MGKSMPKTLLQHAGLGASAINTKSSVLILIDFQKEYTEGSLLLPEAQEAIRIAKEVLNEFRSIGQPVVHIVHHSKPGAPLFDPDTRNIEISDPLTPINGETVVTKTLPSAFTNTGLDKIIKDTGFTELVICGFMTHMCVSSTARSAAELGYKNIVVANACATRDLPNPMDNNTQVNANEVHQATLAAINDRFATVVNY